MPLKQHAIPQNIMDVEFKLVGDLTLRQFIYLSVGLAIAYISFVSNVNFLIKWTIITLFGGGGLAFAFLPISDRSLDIWLINFFTAVYSPTRRIWRKSGQDVWFLLEGVPLKAFSESIKKPETPPRLPLSLYLREEKKAEKNTLDIKEEEFLKRLEFEQATPIRGEPILEMGRKEGSPLPALEKRKMESHLKPLASEINYSLSPVFPVYTPEKGPLYSSGLKNIQVSRRIRLHKEALPSPPKPPLEKPPIKPKIIPQIPKEELKPESKEEQVRRNRLLLDDVRHLIEKIKSYQSRKLPAREEVKKVPQQKGALVREEKKLTFWQRFFPRKEKRVTKEEHPKKRKPAFLDFLREERTKRVPPQKILQGPPLPEKPQKEAVSPPRWEKPLETRQPPPKEILREKKTEIPTKKIKLEEEERELLKQNLKRLQEELKTKTGSDQQGLISDIRRTIEYYREQLKRAEEEKETATKELEKQKTLQKEPKKEAAPPQLTKLENQIKTLIEGNNLLLSRLEAEEKELEKFKKRQWELDTESDFYNRQLATYNRQLEKQERLVESLEKEKEKLEKQLTELKEMKRAEVTKGVEARREEIKKEVTGVPVPKKGTFLGIQPEPNVINGIVKGKKGDLIKGAIVIVKDVRGSPVRALKTNELGQFIISTPLPNGKYQITVETPGENFDIIEAEITGTVLKPVIFQGC